jgi:hypothetical protein
MKAKTLGQIGLFLLVLVALFGLAACGEDAATALPDTDMHPGEAGVRIIFLHHSTGGVIWEGGVERWFDDYNTAHGTDYQIEQRAYPNDPYPWNNYPYDYWNLWVEHEGNKPYKGQDTLDILIHGHDVVVWKHCFPVSAVEPDSGSPQVSSEVKSLENYKLQYEALKEKMHQYPDTQFLVWTGAALTQAATDEGQAQRAQAFFDWVKGGWDEPGDNIYLWDFRQLETEGGLYLRDEYAAGADDSHPNSQFAERVAPLFAQRVVDVIEGRGDSGSLTGE